MSVTIQIKRSQVTPAPPELAVGELAWSEVSDTLFVGESGNAVTAIAGPGHFARLESPAFAGSPVAPTPLASDDSTRIATTAFVKGQGFLASNQEITLSGDASGSGTTAIAVTLASTGVPQGTYPKVTVDTKGRVTAGSALVASDIPTISSAKIDDFDGRVRQSRLDQMAAPTSDVNLGGHKITGLAAPAQPDDAATKAYVDSMSAGIDPKESVRAATVAGILLSGEQAIDGVAVIPGDRVLVKDQAAGEENGIYVASNGAWIRAGDFNTDLYASPGAFCFVEEGAINGDTGWVLATDHPITLGTTPLQFVQFSGGGDVIPGAGLSKIGNTLDVVGTPGRIAVGANSVDIASNYEGQETITKLGTVTVGVWGATAIGATAGGTGITSYAIGDLLCASSTTTLSRLTKGSQGSLLQMGPVIPAWSNVLDGGAF